MNIKKIEGFLKTCSCRQKGRFLLIRNKKVGYNYDTELRIIKRPRSEYLDDYSMRKLWLNHTPVLNEHDFEGFDLSSLIRVIFAKGNLEGCYYFDHKLMSDGIAFRPKFYSKSDIYSLAQDVTLYPGDKFDLFCKKSDIMDRLLVKRLEKELREYWPQYKAKYENVRNIARSVRREIYTLFRYFSDAELRKISYELFGTKRLKKYGDDAEKLIEVQRIINKLLNYSEQIDGYAEKVYGYLLETEKRFSKDNDIYSLPDVYRYNNGITFEGVIELIKSAKYGSIHKKQESIK